MAPIPATALGLSSAFDLYVFLPITPDDSGANDAPAQSDLNAFTRADNVANRLAVAWTWDDINSWGGGGQTGDACALFDTDSPQNGFVDYALCVRITNASDGSVVQLPLGQSPQLYSCGDKKSDRCASPNALVTSLGQTRCEVVQATNGFDPLGDDGFDTLAGCIIDLAATGNATKANLVNVCSFPSGAPNSNAFDCVVTQGSGFLQIKKATAPDQSGATFSFTVGSVSGTFNITDNANTAGDDASQLIPVAPGTGKSITETTIPSGWSLTSVTCVRGTGGTTGTLNGTTMGGIAVDIGETVVCTFTNNGAPSISVTKTPNLSSIPETGGSVVYTVVVTNNSSAAVTLNSLNDNVFGDITTVHGSITAETCVTGGSIAVSGTYSCTFTATLPAAGTGITSHKNTVTASASNAGGTATATAEATVNYDNVAPTITLVKTAGTPNVPETGGSVEFTVTVNNTSAEAVTLTSLTDNVFGNLDGKGNCDVPQTIAASGSYSCKFTEPVSGSPGTPHVNEVTGSAHDDDSQTPVTAKDTAKVTFDDVAPTVTVTKTASPTSIPESGGSVTYTVSVKNESAENVTVTALTDDRFGNLNATGNCGTNVVGQSIAPGATKSCTFSKTLAASDYPSTHTNTVTVTVQDDDGTTAQDTDDETVTFTDVLPDISVTKSPNPTTVPETGGSVTYTVTVTNSATEAVTLTYLVDDKFGDLTTLQGSSCATGGVINPNGGTYSCTFTGAVPVGDAPGTHVNTVTAKASDNDSNEDTATAQATVTYTNVVPNISVTKTPNPAQLSTVTGGTLNFTADAGRTYLTNPTGGGGGGLNFATPTCDDAGANDQPAQVDLNCFNRADNQIGQVGDAVRKLGVRWTWDDINSWGGSGQTGDACALIDTDNDGKANFSICARIQNNAQGAIVQVPNAGAAVVYLCSDQKDDRCTKPELQSNIGTTTCGISTITPDGIAGGEDGADVQAECSIDLNMPGTSGVASLDLINVCSFPSGEPNSSAFDCVVKIGSGFLQIVKVTDPSSTQQFGFTLTPASTNGDDQFIVAGGVATPLIPVAPGTNAYDLVETLPPGWTMDNTTACTIDGQGTGSLGTNKVDNFSIKTGQTTICTFRNTGQITGNVTYTIVVTNNGKEAVTLTSLTDNRFGDLTNTTLNPGSSCVTGGSIAANGGTYTCTFSKVLTQNANTSHTNTVTAVATDDEGTTNPLNSATATATVQFVAPAPPPP